MSAKIEMKLNLLDDTKEFKYPEKPGDAIMINYETHKGLCWCCPKCGEPTSSAKGHRHVFDPQTQSLTPSIVHAEKLGGCGWHGWLKNGIFKEC